MNRMTMVWMAALIVATPAVAQAPVTKAAAYVPAAGASDLYEKMSSDIVLKDAKNAKVRSFAQMMLSDHTKTTAQVTAAAKASGLTVAPPKLMPKQSKMIADLKAATPATREKVYLTQQVAAHREALALHQGYAGTGDVPALRKVASGAVPIIEHHLAEVTALDAAM